MSDQLPTALLVEATLKPLNGQGIFYYITNKGNHASGVIMLKLSDMRGQCRLLIQQRDLDGNMGWMHALGGEMVEEQKADDYIRKSISRDPDLWVIEIEDETMTNPFEGKII